MKRNKNIIISLVGLIIWPIVFFSSFSFVAADFDLAKWQFKKDVLLSSEIFGKKFVEIIFDNEIFEGANKDLSDIRVVDGNGKEVPYIFTIEAPSIGRESFPAQIFNKGSTQEFTSFTVDLGKEGILHNQLQINTDSRNFRREVVIEASSDQVEWLVLASNRHIYDYTLEFQARDTIIKYSDVSFRYLRVKIFDRGEPPINVVGVEAGYNVTNSGTQIFYDGKIIKQEEDAAHKAYITLVDLGTKLLPTNSL